MRKLTIITLWAATTLVACGGLSQGITADTSCLDYLGYPTEERARAVRVLGVEAGWSAATNPVFGGINSVDAACGSYDDPAAVRLGSLLERFAENS